MSSNVNKQEFRLLIERQFLPYVVKPARFLASEWRAGAAEKNAPLAVIVSGASYESSLGSPLASAVSEALIDSRLCDVGWLYQFSDQASERLFSIGTAPFVTPQLVRLTDAKLVIAALSRPSDIFSALKNLDRAGVEFAKSARLAGKKGSQPEFIAVTDSRSCFESLRQEVFGEVFDRVYSLD
ncbi:MAG: hypothetical protein IH914_07980, partial [candidate division Zixibacteria bacterium]|nr:hypothetical protein [candidate division Zixibacteria bacterium]